MSAHQDSLHVLNSIHQLPDQCRQVIGELSSQPIPSHCSLVDNIVVSGMGGSALGGRIIAGLERQVLKVPIVVSTEYHLPHFVGPKTLVVISSYSGNTEETLSSLVEARARNAQVFIIASGGKLADTARQQDLPHYIFEPRYNPSGQPRMGLGYAVISLAMLLSRCQLIHPIPDLTKLPDFLKSRQDQQEQYKEIAQKLSGKIPVIFAAEHLKGAAHAFRNQINENAKTFAALFDLPEANHHLSEGLTFPKTNPENLTCLFIHSQYYHKEVSKRFVLTEKLAVRQHLPVVRLQPAGPSKFFELMDLLQAGSYISFYLSQTLGIDPGPIPWVDWYKDEIRKVV